MLESANDALVAQLRDVLEVHGAHHGGDIVLVHAGRTQVEPGSAKGEGVKQAQQLVAFDVSELIRAHGADQATHVFQALRLVEIDIVEHVEGRAGIPTAEVVGVQTADGRHDLVLAHGGQRLMLQRSKDAAQVFSAQYGAVKVRGEEVDLPEHVHQLAVFDLIEVLRPHGAQEPSDLALELIQALLEEPGVEERRRRRSLRSAFKWRSRRGRAEEGGLKHGERLVAGDAQEVFRRKVVDRARDEVLVETPDVFHIKLAESAGPLVASKVELLAFQAILEKVGDEARIQVLETLVIQILQLAQQVFRRDEAEVARQ